MDKGTGEASTESGFLDIFKKKSPWGRKFSTAEIRTGDMDGKKKKDIFESSR